MNDSNQGDYLGKAAEWRWLGGVALVAYVLGFLGFFQHFTDNFNKIKDLSFSGVASAFSNSAYYALQMLVLNTPTLDNTPLLLHVGRFLAALVFFWAIGRILLKIFSWDLQVCKLMGMKNQVIICGLGQLGLPLALQVRESRKMPVVAIEKDPEAPGVHTALSHGIPVVIGDAAEAGIWQRARIGRASQVFAVCSDDATNIGVAALLSRAGLRPPGAARLECWLFLGNPGLRDSLQQHEVFPSRGTDCTVNVRGLDVGTVMARLAFANLDLEHLELPEGSGKRPRLILMEFGEVGQSLALQAARIAHFPSGGKLQILVLDEQAPGRVASFRRRFPNFQEAAEIVEIQGSLENPEARDRILREYQTAATAGELLAAALCHEAEAAGNLALALELERELPAGKAPLLVYVNSRCGWSTLLPASGPALNNPRLRAFGMLEDVWTMETLRDENQDKLARAFHKIYGETQARRRREGEELALRPAEKPWEHLEESYRAANRAVADHLPIKLQAAGWKMLPQSDPRAQADLDISELQKLILSRMEHARWCAERWLAGWTCNPQRDDDKKQHNLLIPWEQLPENERRLDKEMIDNIPKALQEIGYGVAPKVI